MMKADFFQEKRNKVRLSFIVVTLMVSMTSCLWSGYGDVLREGITLDEAQSLVSFPICIPNYIPQGVDPNPLIIYLEDAAGVPEETYIRLRYKRIANQERAFEVYQRFTNDEGMKIEYPDSQLESLRGGATVYLVDWISPDLTSSERRVAIAKAKSEADSFQTDQTVWWLFKIVEPSGYRSTMTEWIINNIEYWILAYLSTEEIEKVTLSMIECSKP
jgi:hypothetical protein